MVPDSSVASGVKPGGVGALISSAPMGKYSLEGSPPPNDSMPVKVSFPEQAKYDHATFFFLFFRTRVFQITSSCLQGRGFARFGFGREAIYDQRLAKTNDERIGGRMHVRSHRLALG